MGYTLRLDRNDFHACKGGFGADGDLLVWHGPADITIDEASTANGEFAITVSDQVWVWGVAVGAAHVEPAKPKAMESCSI